MRRTGTKANVRSPDAGRACATGWNIESGIPGTGHGASSWTSTGTYWYDIHGNVKELLQHHPQLGDDLGDPGGAWKQLRYRYDLISGNVKQVDYQDGEPDQFHHRYSYDADNRIERVETSRNGLVWREDARYFYYPHGPLARVELGQNKVQGIDYAYTLQGWLKGINSTLLTPENDMGQDAAYEVGGNPNALIGRDVYGLTLGYYGDNDYAAIDPARWSTVAERAFAPMGTTGTMAAGHKPLYNGNIATTANTLAPFGGYPDSPTAPGQVLAMVYEYDQLNRLKQAQGIVGITTENDWDGITDATDYRYRSLYAYDANGNISTTTRYDANGDAYDRMTYHYHIDGDGRKVRNRLYHVNEGADEFNTVVNQKDDGFEDYPYNATAPQDLDDAQLVNANNNYGYDALGNLVRDDLEKIALIDWTVAGKVRRVERTAASGAQHLSFGYGADGQRIAKTLEDENGDPTVRTHYIRDAQGNIMATYDHNVATGSVKVKERPVYGSSRVGVDAYEVELAGAPPYDPMADPTGLVNYELSDHLGNVTTVITDELLGVDVDNDTEYDYFQPYILSAQGYEPFGSLLPGRNYDRKQGSPVFRLLRMLESTESVTMDLNGTPVVLATYNGGYTTIAEYLADILAELGTNSITASIVGDAIHIHDWPANSELTNAKDLAVLQVSSYRHLFQGQEHDDEIFGATGTSYAFTYRMHDPRVGRFWSIDPLVKKYPQWSPYSFSGNQVTATVELEGLEPRDDMSPVGAPPVGRDQLGQLGTANGAQFNPNYTLMINRTTETARSTISTYSIRGGNPHERPEARNITGYMLEPAGPSTAVADQDRRIPAGSYNLRDHNGRDFQNVPGLYNAQVPAGRGILIHPGNYPRNTTGCLLPGTGQGTDMVTNSVDAFDVLNSFMRAVGYGRFNVQINEIVPAMPVLPAAPAPAAPAAAAPAQATVAPMLIVPQRDAEGIQQLDGQGRPIVDTIR